MKEFVKKIAYSEDQPCVVLENGLQALIDTGAKIPVWTKSEELLLAYYPNAEKVLDSVEIGLLEGTAKGSIWKIDLVFGKLIFPRIPVFVCSSNEVEYTFLFSNSMFRRLEIRLDQFKDTFHVIIPDGENEVRNLSFFINGKNIVLVQI